ncbi:hypothetical protein [Streptomyces sp. TLI_171]|nr:hypothetical protein [Streptomyces sp. TLI_171]
MSGNVCAVIGGRSAAAAPACPRLSPAPTPLLTSRRAVDFGFVGSACCR